MKRIYSKSSNLLLLNTFVMTLAIFMLNPYLVIGGGNLLKVPDSDISFFLMISLLCGSIISLILGLSSKRNHAVFILIVASAGSVLAFFMLSQSIRFYGFEKLIFLFALIILRSCMACASIFTRAIHFSTNRNVDCSYLFATTVAVFGIGSALGPILGGWIYQHYGFNRLLQLAMLISLISFFLVIFGSPIMRRDVFNSAKIDFEYQNKVDDYSLIRTWPLMLASVLFFCMLGQSLSFIPVEISKHGSINLVSTFFSVNAIILFILPIPLARYLEKMKVSATLSCIIGLVSMTLSIIMVPFFCQSLYGVLYFTILYSIGEVTFSTYSIEILKKVIKHDQSMQAITIYSFLTTSIGIGLGQYCGMIFLDFFSSFELVLVWLVILFIAIKLIIRMEYK